MKVTLRSFKIFINTVVITVVVLLSTTLFFLYGPIHYFRDLYVTTAMTTLNHKWLATMLFPDNTIIGIMSNNVVIESGKDTNDNLINVGNGEVKIADDDPLKPDADNPDYKMTKIKVNGNSGYLISIYNPKNIKMGVSKSLGDVGEKLSIASRRDNALVAINANGFVDVEGHGNGGVPTGLIINNSKVVYNDKPKEKHSIIGFNNNGVLMLGKYTANEAIKAGYVMAAEFGPFLIVNGEPAATKGNGGWGEAPRTAIGQRKDGVVLLLVVDGRNSNGLGASIVDVMEVMKKYGAVNAANLDGGSSSVLAINGKIVNKPSTPAGERYVPNWFMLVK